uniref:Glucose-methanol-choline oxidoreductase N-terminal domain-containing protein n=1 Tax=Arcella intermedia TaxID=1963864 RepID=A0A6B2L0X6_9EUKA
MRGRGWGGSTTINGQVHVRGTKKNFDDWSDITGDETWDFEHVLPVFKKIENNVWHKDSIWHGTKGFNKVSRVLQGHDEWVDPKNYEVWNSITSAGIPFVDDIHGDPKTYAGLSYCSASVGFDPVTGHGTRSWVGKDLLKPAAERCSKLRIKSRSLVTRILFDGTRAVGVEYIEGEGIYSTEVNSTMGIRNAALHKKKFAFARMGVIVAAGTVNTPQLLKLSGIGPRAELEQFDIPVVVDLPGVGENLQDHVEFTVNYQFDSPTYIDSLGCSYGPRDASDPCATQYNRYYGTSGRVGNLDWNFDKKGEVECHAILSTDYPIWDFDHLPRPDSGPFPFPGIFGWLNEIMNPKSRGSVTLQSADPTEAPFIDPRYYSHPDDLRKAVGCWKLIEGIMANVSHAELFRPDPTTVTTDQEVEDYLRNIAWGHHMTGTARMGRKCDKMAVLDTNLRPFGTQNLYVVDASAFPKIVAGQPTFAVYMLAQKAFWKIKNFEKNMHNCEARF